MTARRRYEWNEPVWLAPRRSRQHRPTPPVRHHVVAYDFGIKRGILRRLRAAGCRVTVVPAATRAKDVLALKPDGVFLSNGPGDPAAVGYAVEAARELVREPRCPIFGICLGHQILGLALGGKTYKLKFGHHGANHPVMDLGTRKVEITSQNHGFAVDVDSLEGQGGADARQPERQDRRGHAPRQRCRCSACSTTPRPRPARTTPPTSSIASCTLMSERCGGDACRRRG